jgi:hypothetical protein
MESYLNVKLLKELNMNKQTDISKAQALTSLAEIETTNEKCKRLYRTPIWMNVVLASLAAVVMFAECVRHINHIWYDIQFYGLATFIIVGLLRYLYLKKQGIKLKLMSSSSTSFMIIVGTTIYVVLIKSLGSYYVDAGYAMTPYIIALVTFVWFFYLTYKYPSYDLIEFDN